MLLKKNEKLIQNCWIICVKKVKKVKNYIKKNIFLVSLVIKTSLWDQVEVFLRNFLIGQCCGSVQHCWGSGFLKMVHLGPDMNPGLALPFIIIGFENVSESTFIYQILPSYPPIFFHFYRSKLHFCVRSSCNKSSF